MENKHSSSKETTKLIKGNGPETKPNLAQAKKPSYPQAPNDGGKEKIKYKGYAELNQDTGRSDLAGPVHV